MDTSGLTHDEKLILAEVTAAITEAVTKEHDELQIEYDAGVLDPTGMASANDDMFNSLKSLLYRYANQMRISGNDSLSEVFGAWGDSYAAKATEITGDVGSGKLKEAVVLGMEMSSSLAGNDAAIGRIESSFGAGAGGVAKKIFTAAGDAAKAIDAWDAMNEYFAGDTKSAAASAIVGIVASPLINMAVGSVVATAGLPIVLALTVAGAAAAIGIGAESLFKEFGTLLGWEDPSEAKDAVMRSLESGHDVDLRNLGNHFFWGDQDDNSFVGSDDKPNDMAGMGGNDSLTGGAMGDFLNGGDDNDTLTGKSGDDSLIGGNGDDTLTGGSGNDTLEGGSGNDQYQFSTDDLTQSVSTDVISDSDGAGSITIDGTELGGLTINEYFTSGTGVLGWQADDYKYTFTWSQETNSLVVTVRSNGSKILINDWHDGDLGITLPDYNATNPPASAPLTNNDDLFGNGGNNSGNDQISALGGNDGISAGAGDDYIDAGDGNDLIYGGSGNDQLSGGSGADVIIDDSEQVGLEDWSDAVGDDGKSQRQREEDNIQQLGAAVIAQGKGWYVYTSQDGGDTVYNIVTADGSQILDPNQSPSGDDHIDGGDGNDVIWSGEGRDTVYGGADEDYIDGGADDDVIYGGDGADKIWGDTPAKQVAEGSETSVISTNAQANGNDIISGGTGDDTVDGGGGNDLIDGGDGADLLLGNGNPETVDPGDPDMDVINGGIGNDTIFGDDGNDTIHGGADDDLISGDDPNSNTRDGNDEVYGDAGNDTLLGGGADDVLYGGAGDDSIMGDSNLIDGSRHGNDTLHGGDGKDTMAGGGGDDFLLGDDGNDLMHGDNAESVLDPQYDGNDYVEGGKGEDTLYGDGGDDTLSGGAGADVLSGGKGNDFLYGGDDADQLTGDEGDDWLYGEDGNDSMWGESGGDVLYGGDGDDLIMGDDPNLPADQQGDDVIDGGSGNDSVYGGGGNDQIDGGSGVDLIFGDAGNDTLLGGDGDDDLTGGAGNDQLVGGAGNDTYHFESGFGIDRILQVAGEDAGQDVISFGASINATDLGYSLDGDDLVIHDSVTGDVLTVRDYFGPGASVDIHFDDGSATTKADLEQLLGLTTPPIVGSGAEIDGTDSGDRIYGDDGDNTIYGQVGDDYINGGAGDDQIYGGPGNDTLEGGAGNDTYYVGDDALETIVGLGDSDAGSDTIVCDFDASAVNNYQVSGDDLYIFRDLADPKTILLKGFLSDTNGTHVIQFLDGELTADDFRDNPSSWTGTSGDDFFQGGDADDLLHGEGGDDTISGGGGDDHIYGDAGQDVLRGDAGNDNLTDLDGTMYGGTGDDNYYVIQNPYTVLYGIPVDIVENPGEGTDTIYTNAYDATLPDNVENLVARPSNFLLNGYGGSVDPRDLVGNDLDNVITIDTASTTIPDDIVYKLDGGAGADTLNGSIYDDIYVVDNPNDVIVEPGTGSNQSFDIVQAKYSYHLDPASNIEEVQLLGSNDLSAWGTDGADILDGSTSSGSNTLYGGAGDDQYVLGVLSGDTVVEDAGGGNDTVTLTLSAIGDPNTPTSFSLSDYANVENLTLDDVEFTLTGPDYGGDLSGDAGNNVLTGNGYANVIHGGDGNDTVIGGHHPSGSNLTEQSDELYGDAGDDTLEAGWGGGDLYGGDGNDSLQGGTSTGSQLHGDAGDDTLVAGRGGSDLYGGTGDDLLQGDQGADNFHYDAGDGTDTIDSTPDAALDQVVFGANVTTDDVSFSRDGTTLIVQVGTDAANQVRVDDYWADTSNDAALTGAIDQFVFADGTVRKGGLDHLPYTNNPPVAQVTSLDFDVTEGQAVSYQLPSDMFTDAPDDTLTLSLQNAPSWLSIDGATGLLTGTPPDGAQDAQFQVVATDTWGQTASATLSMNAYNLVQGTSGDDSLTGTAGRDAVYGLAGNDVLDGAGGVDHLIGGAGDDEYHVHDSATTVTENAGEGQDTVIADVDYSLGDNVENLTLASGSSAVQATGNAADNMLVGNALDNVLDGGQGADTMQGGAGNDTYYVDQAGDQVQENAGEGTDTVVTTLDWTLGDNVENLTLTGSAGYVSLTGNGLDNVLVGNDNTTYFDGGAGADTMIGGSSIDFYTVDSPDDVIVEAANGGYDGEYRTYESTRALDSNVETLQLADGLQTGTGNELDNAVYGNDSANTLFGLAGDDYLEGDGGDDYLDGGTGADEMDGGTGDDTYVVDSVDDLVVENADEGTDAVQASVSYTLTDNVENLFLGGSGAIDGTGNALGNYLSGNVGANTLRGMDGDDTLAGGGGDDTLAGGTGDDAYVFDGSAGNAVIDNTGGGNDGIVFSNGINAGDLSFAQDGNDLLVFVNGATTPAIRVTDHFLGGDAAVDFLQTADGTVMTTDQINQAVSAAPPQYDQTVVGTSGADTLTGGTGNDLIQGLDGADQLFGMGGDDDLQGGAGDDYLSGGDGSGSGSGADTLEGGDGNDTLVGEDGNDTMIGGLGDDQYVYGGGQDVIDTSDGGNDGIFFKNGITASDLAFSRDGDDLVITVSGDAASTVRVTNHFLGGDAAIDYVQPASGSMLDTAAINALVDGGSGGGTSGETGNDADYGNVVDGTSASEQLLGSSGRDLIHGLGGDDTIFGFGGDDKFEGGDGNDYLSGGNGSFSGSGNDILIGGAGDDTLVGEDGDDMLIGGTGNDQYVWQTGSGSDTIDNTGGGTDWLFFNDIDRTRLGFHQDGDDLVIMVDEDSTQSVRVKNYFLGGDYVISYIQPSDGYAIPASDIDGMLTPMPSGASPAAVSATMIEPSMLDTGSTGTLSVTDTASSNPMDGLSRLDSMRDQARFARHGGDMGMAFAASLSQIDSPWSGEQRQTAGNHHPDPQVHRLIQAMSDFIGDRIAPVDPSTHDESFAIPLSMERSPHRLEFTQHEHGGL